MTGNFCYKYPRPAVTTDCVIFGHDGAVMKLLLIKRGNEPYKDKWAFPGGFLNMDESAEEGVKREVKEETGLNLDRVEQIHTFTNPDRDPRGRVITIAYFAKIEIREVKGGDDAKEARWFNLDSLPELAFDHDQILKMALDKLKEK